MPRMVEFQIVPCHIEQPPGIGAASDTAGSGMSTLGETKEKMRGNKSICTRPADMVGPELATPKAGI
jgi:hypothetical protein